MAKKKKISIDISIITYHYALIKSKTLRHSPPLVWWGDFRSKEEGRRVAKDGKGTLSRKRTVEAGMRQRNSGAKNRAIPRQKSRRDVGDLHYMTHHIHSCRFSVMQRSNRFPLHKVQVLAHIWLPVFRHNWFDSAITCSVHSNFTVSFHTSNELVVLNKLAVRWARSCVTIKELSNIEWQMK